MKLSKIYKLVDPRTNSPRYVGKTTRALADRLNAHWGSRNRIRTQARLMQWFKELEACGQKPRIELIEEAYDLGLHESKWISRFITAGHDMLNHYSREYSYYSAHPTGKLYNPKQDAALLEAYPDATVYHGSPLTPKRTA